MDIQSNNRRIAKNTAYLYGRLIFTMVVSFFTAGILLNLLGVTNYGIYGVVGGLVSMFSLVSGTLSASSTRYITYELGKDNGNVRGVFNASFQIHLFLAIIVVILLETVGLWFLTHKMTIPSDRMTSAIVIYQFSICSFVISLLNVSYSAVVIAHEHIKTFAKLSVLDVVFKLAVLYLLWIIDFDKLIVYGFLNLLVSLTMQSIYFFYCKFHFEEARLKRVIEKDIIKEMGKFAGWNFIGASASLLNNQGVNIIINLFYGPVANAARSLSLSIQSMIASFGNNIYGAINPQITKNYALNNMSYTFSLIYRASRLSFMLMYFVAFPFMVRCTTVMNIWLHNNIPENAVPFTILSLICVLVDTISIPLITLMLATGDIKWYQIIVGGTLLLNLPISYLVLYLGAPPQTTMVVAIIISLICLNLRLIMLKPMVKINIKYFYQKVILRVIYVVSITSLFFFFTTSLFPKDNFLYDFIYIIISGCINAIVIYYTGLYKNERISVINFIKSKVFSLNKIFKQ